MRVQLITCFLLAAAAVPGRGAAETNSPAPLPITPEMIGQLAEEARTNNLALRAASARVEAAEANTRSIRTWEDPTVSLGIMAAEREMRREDGDLIHAVEQKLPVFGKPQAERRVAEAAKIVQESDADTAFQRLRRDIALQVFETALGDRTIAVHRDDLAWIGALLATVEERYAVGDASQSDLLRLQTERARRANEIEAEVDMQRQRHWALNRKLNRELTSPWPALELPEIAQPVVFNERLIDFAMRYEPELRTKRMEIKEAEASVEAVRRQRYPDMFVGAEVRNYTGTGEFREGMVSFGITVPWGNRKRYEAAEQREKALVRARQLETSDYEVELRREIHQLAIEINNSRREALLYRDEIVPRARLALDTAQETWIANRGMFRDVLEARRMLLDAELMYARAVAEQYRLMSDLVLCCGLGDFEALRMIGAEPESPDPKKD